MNLRNIFKGFDSIVIKDLCGHYQINQISLIIHFITVLNAAGCSILGRWVKILSVFI